MRFSISKELLEKMLDYLSTQPYKSVSGLIGDVVKDVQQVEEVTKPTEE